MSQEIAVNTPEAKEPAVIELASADDIATIRDLLKDIRGGERKTCDLFHIEKLEDLPAAKVSRVIAALRTKYRQSRSSRITS